MIGFIKCVNGHFFKQGLTKCPYCISSDNVFQDRMPANKIHAEENVSKLLTSQNSIFKFDIAPDGIKRYIKTNRKLRDFVTLEELNGYLHFISQSELGDIHSEIVTLQSKLDVFFLRKNIYHLNIPDLKLVGDYFIVPSKIKNYFSRTILDTIFNKYRIHQKSLSANTNQAFSSANSMSAIDFEKIADQLEHEKYLAMDLSDLSNLIVSTDLTGDFSKISKVKKYQEEDFSCLKPIVRTTVLEKNIEKNCEYEFSIDAYKKDLIKLKNDELHYISFLVDSQRIAQAFSSIFKQLSEMHAKNLIHADIKPDNIICAKEGFLLIDSLDVRNEDIAIGLTPGHCAPEQILGLPISPASDIHNLGLIVLKLVRGKLYGKTSNFVIPFGRENTENISFISEPYVYIDSKTSNVNTEIGRAKWREFLEKSLAFDPKNRHSTIEEFEQEFEDLLLNFPLQHSFEFRTEYGQLELVEESENGEAEIAWIMQC